MHIKRRDVPLALGALMPTTSRALDPSQRRWVGAHPQLRFAPEADYGPFVFRAADGQVTGLSIDLLELVVEQTGLSVALLSPQPLSGILDGLRRGEIDFASSLRPTLERAEFLRFTRPYIDVPAVLAVPAGKPSPGWDALAGQPVAVGAGYAVEAHVRHRHPKLGWVAVPSDADALAGLAAGTYAGAVLDVASLAFVTQSRSLPPFQVAEAVGFQYSLSFAVRKSLPGLIEVLDTGLAAVAAPRRQAVIQRWLGPYADQLAGPGSPIALRIGLGCVVAAAGLSAVWGWQRVRRAGGVAAVKAPS
jgi:ABC-type amino acid transport substrate-binding protein